MIIKKMINTIKNPNTDFSERCFLITNITSAVTLAIIFFWDIYIGESTGKLIMLGATVILTMIAVMFFLQINRLGVGSVLVGLMMILIVLPHEYFTGGGVYGCTPIWFAYSFLYMGLNIGGRKKYFMLFLTTASAIGCYLGSYFFPEILTVHDSKTAHLDSVASLIGVGIMLYLTVEFLMKLYNDERLLAKKQAKEIKDLNDAQNQFFSSMSHEIRTPINTIIGLNEMILRENASNEINEDAANIQSASKMLLNLINDILDMSKFQAGQMKLTESSYYTGDMLSDVVGMFWIRAKEKNLEFRVDVAPDLPEQLLGDEVRIKQIIINLVNNAIKYTMEGSVTLSIQCAELGGDKVNVIYSVTDTGMGIKKENIPYLFSAFKRVDEENTKFIEGTGLGLSIVKQLVDLMGGKIAVNSVYTKGSKFIIEIPQRAVGNKKMGTGGLEKKKHSKNFKEYHQSFEAPEAKVLVVDDTTSNLLVVKKLLRDTKVDITTVGSGAEALEKTLNTNYHVIFMDHMMPGMDGIECMHKIRNQVGGASKESKIVVLTANVSEDATLKYAKEGFDGYLMKPVDGKMLESELHRLLPKDLLQVTGSDEEILNETVSWIEEHGKKSNVVITTESVADIPKSLIEKYDIAVLPHMILTESGIFKDGLEIDTKGLLTYMKDDSVKVSTESPDVQVHENFFAEQLKRADNIIHVSISSKIGKSGCIAATEAAKVFDNVFVVDTTHLSSGQGLMVLEACRMAEEGRKANEIINRLEEMKKHVHTSFIVENMDYLARANQVGQKIADITRVFMIRPVLKLKKGKMVLGGTYLGSRQYAWNRYINSALKTPDKIDKRVLFITYVGLSQNELDKIKENVCKKIEFENIYYQEASPAVAVNCGPGTFGLLFATEMYDISL